jgi:hypothetical protein
VEVQATRVEDRRLAQVTRMGSMMELQSTRVGGRLAMDQRTSPDIVATEHSQNINLEVATEQPRSTNLDIMATEQPQSTNLEVATRLATSTRAESTAIIPVPTITLTATVIPTKPSTGLSLKHTIRGITMDTMMSMVTLPPTTLLVIIRAAVRLVRVEAPTKVDQRVTAESATRAAGRLVRVEAATKADPQETAEAATRAVGRLVRVEAPTKADPRVTAEAAIKAAGRLVRVEAATKVDPQETADALTRVDPRLASTRARCNTLLGTLTEIATAIMDTITTRPSIILQAQRTTCMAITTTT